MATLIEQQPLFSYIPAGQDVIFTVSNNNIVTNPLNSRVKFIAEVRISDTLTPNPSNNSQVIGTFKTTPNNASVGMFDFRPIIENFVNADHKALDNSSYKTDVNKNLRVPLHLIDKYSGNNNNFRYLQVKFKIEYFDNDTSSSDFNTLVTTDTADSRSFNLWNAYLKYSDELSFGSSGGNNNWFGYSVSEFNLTTNTKKFLTNAPVIQYANIEDYGTAAILMINPLTQISQLPLTPIGGTAMIKFTYYNDSNSVLDFETIRLDDVNNGGFTYLDRGLAKNNIVYAGIFPANLQGWSKKFNDNIANISYYKVVVQTLSSALAVDISQTYRININCPTLKGYEPIRLCWLNQWGAWDYYTFTMKSIKTISAKGTTYRQLAGTWNEKVYKIDGFKGGKKSFRVDATEKIKMNTDFVSESDSEWFEELINSPEVYILKGYQTDVANSALNKYVSPVRLTTSSYTKKTVANDKIMQYTFEVEKSKTLRTQSI